VLHIYIYIYDISRLRVNEVVWEIGSCRLNTLLITTVMMMMMMMMIIIIIIIITNMIFIIVIVIVIVIFSKALFN